MTNNSQSKSKQKPNRPSKSVNGVKRTRKGLSVEERPQVVTKYANQHVSSPQQELFLDLYLDPKSPTFGNAYKSALEAGYSETYAREITSPNTNNQWLLENPRLKKLTDTHITSMIEDIATDKQNRIADRLKALELSARLKGMLIERRHEVSEVITVSLGLTQSVEVVTDNGSTKLEEEL